VKPPDCEQLHGGKGKDKWINKQPVISKWRSGGRCSAPPHHPNPVCTSAKLFKSNSDICAL